MGSFYVIFNIIGRFAFAVDLHIVPGSCSHTYGLGYGCRSYNSYVDLAGFLSTESGLKGFLEGFPEIKNVEVLSAMDTTELDVDGKPKNPDVQKRTLYLAVDFTDSNVFKKGLFVGSEELKICVTGGCYSDSYNLKIDGPIKIYDSHTPEDGKISNILLNSPIAFRIIADKISSSSGKSYDGLSSIRVDLALPQEPVRIDLANQIIKRGLIREVPNASILEKNFSLSAKVAFGQ